MKKARPESTFAGTVSACPKRFRSFEDTHVVTIADDDSDSHERRFVTLGTGAAGRLLVVIYTWRGENIRIISARPGEPHEHDEYEAEL